MDIGRNAFVAAAVIAALKVCHPVLQYLQKLIHLHRMQFPDFINKQHAAVRFADCPRARSGNPRIAKCPCALINRIMHRAKQGVCNVAFIKLQCGCINLHKPCTCAEGGTFPFLRFLQNQPRCRRFPHTGRAINQNMLRIGTAECRAQCLDAVFLPDDFFQCPRSGLLRQWFCQLCFLHCHQLIHLYNIILAPQALSCAFSAAAPPKIPCAQPKKQKLRPRQKIPFQAPISFFQSWK